jgi:hypothetical protein
MFSSSTLEKLNKALRDYEDDNNNNGPYDDIYIVHIFTQIIKIPYTMIKGILYLLGIPFAIGIDIFNLKIKYSRICIEKSLLFLTYPIYCWHTKLGESVFGMSLH